MLSDAELIKFALMYWANHIETGNVLFSAEDAANRKMPVKVLSDEQKELVLRLRKLAVK